MIKKRVKRIGSSMRSRGRSPRRKIRKTWSIM